MTNDHTQLEFIELPQGGKVARLRINRPDQANAFSAELMTEITHSTGKLSKIQDLRAVVISGQGKHFSAGADLAWMKASAGLSYEENIRDSSILRDMFESILDLQVPKIAVVQGAAYGGALGIVACCDYAIAHTDSKFCLSEARLGLLPAVIAPYLMRKMKMGSLRRFALSAQVFSAQEALEAGLVQIIAENPEVPLKQELNAILACGPRAQAEIIKLFETLRQNNFEQGSETIEAIAKARTSSEGQAGLGSFFSKKPPPWARGID